MSSYRNQRPGSSSRPSSSGSYDRYQRPDRYDERLSQQSHLQQSNATGSTYKPTFGYHRYQSGNEGGSGLSNSYRRDSSDAHRERDNLRDAYHSRRDYHSNSSYRRDGHFSSRGGAPRNHYNSYTGYRGRAERSSGSEQTSYPSYTDRRQRDMHSHYSPNQRSSIGSSRSDNGWPRDTETVDYESNEQSKRGGATRAARPPQSQIAQTQYSNPPPRSRPSLIPKDFRNDEEEDDDETAIERAVRDTTGTRDNSETPEVKSESYVSLKSENSRSAGIADRIPLSEEHKEELEKGTSDESKETSMEPSGITTKTDESSLEVGAITEKIDASGDVKQQDIVVETTEENESDSYEPEDTLPTGHKDQDESNQVTDDSYDPEELLDSTNVPNTETPEEQKDSSGDVIMKDVEKLSKEPLKPKEETTTTEVIATLPQPLTSYEVHPLKDPGACIFPLPRVEQRVWELKNHATAEVRKRLPYLLKQPVKSLAEYPFYERNFLVHKQGVRPRLVESLSIIKSEHSHHRVNLLNEYLHREEDWNARCEDMDDQLRIMYPETTTEPDDPKEPSTTAGSAQDSRNSRRSRHQGDSVRSEAEFMEILKTLEQQEEDDPLHRAEQVAAIIPDMILNPLEKAITLVNTNNLVKDKNEWAQRIHTDIVDTFTKKEHEMFCEAYLSRPKEFGRIAAAMNYQRTALECAIHYYRTKKTTTDYKLMLAQKKKKGGKGRGKTKRKGKSSTNTPTSETPADSGDEHLNLENFIPQEASEELYTDTGRRRRAAAPVFDNNEKRDVDTELRKRSLDGTQSAEGTNEDKIDDKSKKKKQRGPKPTEASDGRHTSYWSVNDISNISNLLRIHGLDWHAIASGLGTKSATMVRNYYLRNADSHGLKDLVSEHDRGTGIVSEISSSEAPNPAAVDQKRPRNPPLGVFTASSDLPSNVPYTQPPPPNMPQFVSMPTHYQTIQHQHETIPVVKPEGGTLLPPLNGPTLPKLGEPNGFQAPQSSFARPTASEPTRSNPFSITSLLNPPAPEEKKSSLPTFPVPGTFSPVTGKREFYSGYDVPSSNGLSRISILNDPTSSGPAPPSSFNPLNALLAAAEDKQWKSESTARAATPPADAPDPHVSNGMGPSFPGRSILNPVGGSPRRPSLNNMLNSDDGTN